MPRGPQDSSSAGVPEVITSFVVLEGDDSAVTVRCEFRPNCGPIDRQ